MRSAREMASMGHFDPEQINPDVRPNYEDGTVDINWDLVQKSNDQVEFSLGWGQTGVIGRIGLKLNNFSMANLFNKNKEHRGILPVATVRCFLSERRPTVRIISRTTHLTQPTGSAESVLYSSPSELTSLSRPTCRATITTAPT